MQVHRNIGSKILERKSILIIFITIFLTLPFVRTVPVLDTTQDDAIKFQKGIFYIAWNKDQADYSITDKSLNAIITRTKANAVTILVQWFQEHVNSTEISPKTEGYVSTIPDDRLIYMINKAHDLGLSVTLYPLVGVNDYWETIPHPLEYCWIEIVPTPAWFESYTNYILHYANIAEEQGVDLFYVGCELLKTQSYETEWREVISKVRQVYHGPIGYATTPPEDPLNQNVAWFDALDFLGAGTIGAALHTETKDPTIEEIQAALLRRLEAMEAWYNQFGKPIILSEEGMDSFDGAIDVGVWGVPVEQREANFKEQADYFEAVFRTFYHKEWLKGIFWGDWFVGAEDETLADYLRRDKEWIYRPEWMIHLWATSSSFVNKPAGEVIANWYSGKPLTYEEVIDQWYSKHIPFIGTVTLENETDHSSVLIELTDYTCTYTTVTNTDGSFDFGQGDLGLIRAGTYTLMIKKPKFDFYFNDSFRIIEDGMPPLSMELKHLTLPPDVYSVDLQGSMNDWDWERRISLNEVADGLWTVTIYLERGVYHYGFVINDQWPEIVDINSQDYATKPLHLGEGRPTPYSSVINVTVSGDVTFTFDENDPWYRRAPAPAKFILTDLSISPPEAEAGQAVTISAKITNIGDQIGSYTVSLMIADVVVDTKDVTLAGGESTFVTFTIVKDAAGIYSVEVDGLVGSFAVRELAPPEFTISDLRIAPAEVEVGQSITISVKVTNVGEQSGSYTVDLKIAGTVVESKIVTLGGGESTIVEFTVIKDVAGSYLVEIDGLTDTFSVTALPPEPAKFVVTDLGISPTEVEVGKNLIISIKVANIGEQAGSYTVDLKVAGILVESKTVTLSGGESMTVTFTVAKEKAGTYDVEVAGLKGTFTVKEVPPPLGLYVIVVAVAMMAIGVATIAYRRMRATS